jgi:Family of unknown function (DUF6084)
VLRFACTGARPEPYAAGPSLELDVRVTAADQPVHAIALRTQIRIEPRRRRYSAQESERLRDLFGEPARYGETLNPLQLATVASLVPSFTGSTTVPLVVPLTYDLDIAATKYLHGLADDSSVPLLLLFSGTVFCGSSGSVQVAMVPWHEEATYQLPVAVWRAAIDAHFPGSGWVRLRRETLEALRAYRSERVLPTWDDAMEQLLKEAR